MLGGPGKRVEVDEVLLRHVRIPGQSENVATIVLGMACEGKVITGIIGDRTRQTLHESIVRFVRRGSTVVTDDWVAYKGLEKHGFNHISVNHSVGFFNMGGFSTCEIDSYWATLRRAMRGYHQVAAHNLWLYLAEIEWRYNFRHNRDAAFDRLVSHWPELTPESIAQTNTAFDWRLGLPV